MRRLARLLPFIAILLLLAIALLVLLRMGPLADQIRAVIASELSQMLDRDVTIGSAGITPSGRVALSDLLVRNDDGTSLLKVPHVSVQVGSGGGLLSVISRPTDIRSVRLVDPEVTLARLPDGKWSVSDLLERPREGPSRFRGSVEVEGGTITVVDQRNDGLTTSLSDVQVSLAYPQPGEAVFTVECGANEGIFDSLELRGRSSSKSGITDVDVEADRVVATYVLDRIPFITFGDVRAGEVDLNGEVRFASGGREELSYDLLIQLSQVEIAFPWLRQPVQGITGEVGVNKETVELSNIAGSVAGAPVTVNGSIADFSAPLLDLHVTSPGIRYAQVQALLPGLVLPEWLVLPGPVEVEADVQGPAADLTATGKASMETIEFGAVPWHGLEMPFEYQGGRLRLRPSAHGSPRRFDADMELDLLKPGPAGVGTASLANFPLSLLAEMAGIQGDFEGTVQADVRGEVDADEKFSGTVQVVDAVIQGVAIGEMEGKFEYANEMLLLPELRLSGPVATGSLEAEISLDGGYEVKARVARLDLSAIGAPLDLRGLRGQCCARLEASGHVGDGIIAGHAVLGPGELQGRHFDSLSGEFSVSQERFAVDSFDVSLDGGRGAGEFVIDNWKGPRKAARLSGRAEISEVDVSVWLPAWAGSASPTGLVRGSVDLAGTLADPEVEVDLLLESLTIADQPFDAGEFRARYENAEFTVEKGHVGVAGGDLSVSGGYAPGTGFSLGLDGRNIELDRLAASWPSQLGLTVKGTLTVKAEVTGPLTGPELSLSLNAQDLSLNQEQFEKLAIGAGFQGSRLEISSFELAQGESTISVSGKVDTQDGAIEVAELDLTKVDIGVVTAIASRAAYRLAHAGKGGTRSRFVQGYSQVVGRLTRLPEGSLTARIEASGSIAEPQIEVISFALKGAAFDGWRMDHIGGSLSVSLGRRESDGVTLRGLELDLEGRQGSTEASLVGALSVDDEGGLDLEVTDLDLQLLWPSLGPSRVQQALLTMTVEPLARGPRERLIGEALRIGGLAAIPRAELHLREASLAPLAGMAPAEFNADIYLSGNTIEIYREGERGGRWAGVQGQVGSGRFSADGHAVIAQWGPGEWEESQFDVGLQLDGVHLALPGVIDAKLDGSVRLTREPDTPGAVLTTRRVDAVGHDPLVVSDATLGVPKVKFGEPRGGPLFSPALDVMVCVGDNVRFRYGSERRPSVVEIEPGHLPEEGEPTGYLHVSGTASAEGAELVGEFESKEGVLAFPNGTLKLERATAWISRGPGEPPLIMVNATAAGRVGDYYVSLRPSGQAVPYDPDLIQLNATSIPPLEEGFVLALLGGTVVAPGAERQSDLAGLLSDPTRGPGREGQIEGVMVPAFSSTSGPEVGFDVATSGQVRLRLAQELSDRFVVSYVSSLTGARESYTLRFIYQVTHLWSIGRAVDELEQGRWEVQAFIPF